MAIMLGTAFIVVAGALANAAPPPPPPTPAASPLMDRARYSLWEGAAAPVALPAALEPQGDDAAKALSGQRFDLTQLRDAVASPGAAAMPGMGAVPLAGMIPKAPGDLFVSVELDLAGQQEGQLKDSLNNLNTSASFRPDARFEPTWLGARRDRVAIWGWMPGKSLSDALKIKGVVQVGVARDRMRAPDEPLRSEFVVGIRMRADDPAPVGATFARVVRQLGQKADFHWRRTIGYQGIPQSKDLALIVVGDAPLRELGDLMAHPDVVKVLPSPDGPSPRKPAPPPERGSFFSYAMLRSPLLVALTVLAAFLSLKRRLR